MTEQELQQFDDAGCTTIDTPLTTGQIANACAAFDRLLPFRDGKFRPSLTCSYFDPALLEILQHPFFEECARQALRSREVLFYQTAIVTTYPEPDTPFSFWQHVDIQYRLSDFQAVPRRIVCSFFLWLTDVNERRAPMMFRPGSHLQIAEIREDDPDWANGQSRVAPVPMDKLPALPYSDPVSLTATAGQVSVLTTAAVHGASVNVDSEPRKVFVLTFVDAGTTIGLSEREGALTAEYYEGLRSRLRPERAHIVPR